MLPNIFIPVFTPYFAITLSCFQPKSKDTCLADHWRIIFLPQGSDPPDQPYYVNTQQYEHIHTTNTSDTDCLTLPLALGLKQYPNLAAMVEQNNNNTAQPVLEPQHTACSTLTTVYIYILNYPLYYFLTCYLD